MTDVRHTTTLEINVDTRRALPDVQRLQAALDRLAATAGRGPQPRDARGRYMAYGSGGGGPGGPGGDGGHWWQGMQNKLGPAGGGGGRGGYSPWMAGAAASAVGAAASGGAAAEWRALTGMGLAGAKAASDRMRFNADGTARGGWVGRLGSAVGASLGVLGAGAVVGGIGLQRYYANAVAAAQTRTRMNEAALYGGGGGFFTGSGYGYGPAEAAAMQIQFGSSAGVSNAMGLGNPFALSRAGLSLGTAGRYAGLSATGSGGIGRTNVASMAGLAQAQGLRGSKVDEYLSTIASATARLADGGLSLNMPATETFLRRMQGSPDMHSRGVYQPRAINAMSGARAGAKQRLFGGFQAIGEAAMLAKAMQGGGGLFDIGRRLEEMSDPAAQLSAIRAFGGDFGASGFFAGQMPVDMATALGAGKLGAPVDMRSIGLVSAKASAGSIALAKGEADKMITAGGGNDTSAINRVNTMDTIMISVGRQTNALLEAIGDAIDTMGIGTKSINEQLEELNRRAQQLGLNK